LNHKVAENTEEHNDFGEVMSSYWNQINKKKVPDFIESGTFFIIIYSAKGLASLRLSGKNIIQ
jgi:hypothetical protein